MRAAIVVSLLAGILGVGSLVYGCAILVRETRLAVVSISEDARSLSERHPTPDDAGRTAAF